MEGTALRFMRTAGSPPARVSEVKVQPGGHSTARIEPRSASVRGGISAFRSMGGRMTHPKTRLSRTSIARDIEPRNNRIRFIPWVTDVA